MITLKNTQNEQNKNIYEWILSYEGNFDFLLSLKAQLQAKGSLSEKQVSAAERCRNKERPKLRVVAAPVYSVKAGDVLEVNRSFAKKMAKASGSLFMFYNIEVLEVLDETMFTIKIRTKASARVTSHCCVCGRSLTDPASILSGIGPVCAKMTNIPHGEVKATKEALELLVSKEIEVTSLIPKSAIKNLESLKKSI